MSDPGAQAIKNSAEFAEYAASLRKLLWELLEWDEARVSAHLEDALENPGFRVYYSHDGPCKEAAWLVVRERVRKRVVGLAGVRLRQRVERAITQTGTPDAVYFPDQHASYDWDAARARIARVLKTYDSNP